MTDEIHLTEGRFRGMGSPCRVVTDLDADAVERAVDRVEDLEARWSRFRPESEISECNRRAGDWVIVSPPSVDLIRRAQLAFERTAGRFHPFMLSELEALGYDQSHEELPDPDGPMIGGDGRPVLVEPVQIDGTSVRIPPKVSFDPGGIGKGLAADIVVADLLDAGAAWAVVSVGDDLRLAGHGLEECGWQVEIGDPWDPGAVWAHAVMRTGALATTSTLARRWAHGDRTAHQILDPWTGLPTLDRRVAATVHAADAWWADVVAKCCIVDVSLDRDLLAEWGVVAVAFSEPGMVEELGWGTEVELAEAS